ncbi:MAG TPA: sigma-70 family RNA polymerase sigma factor [Chitinophagales bacterium]|nr:sigma-70 family RNA polymerase sigma factor [Chitinophagales bacterium]
MPASSVPQTVDHLFRHEYGKLVSVLTRIFGTHNLELAEDVVQDTLLKALEQWKFSGIPENPSAWLFRVAKNKALDVIRHEKIHNKFAEDVSPLLKSEYTLVPIIKELFSETEIKDDVLRMMFACCHSELPPESQVALILKTLCGFSIEEIAKAFITHDETISKRLYRAKQEFRESKIQFEIPSSQQIEHRLENVLTSLYLLFNEGYNSTSHSKIIRNDLVEEAVRLCYLLTENEATNLPPVNALLALMLFHAARLESRLDKEENILLLEEQDRSRWDRSLINAGIFFFEKAMHVEPDGQVSGLNGQPSLTIYHLQAAIAFQHVSAPSFEKTDWNVILQLYDLLCDRYPSPVAALNRAIALAHVHGPLRAIEAVNAIPEKEKLKTYYLLPATLGELYFREHDFAKARNFFEEAISLTKSQQEKKLFERKLAKCVL